MKAYSRLIVTCSTFALYTASFTKSANNAIAAADTPDGDHSMAKRWDILGKFETNFNHWYVFSICLVAQTTASKRPAISRFKVSSTDRPLP